MAPRLDTATIFERMLEVYRRQFIVFVPAALICFIPVAVLQAFVRGSGTKSIGLAVAALGIGVIATFAYQALVVEAVRDIQDGVRDKGLNDLFGAVAPVLMPVIGAAILLGIGVGIGLVLLIVPGLILFTWWSLVIPIVVLERPGVGASFGRSRELVRGNGWRVFGVLVVLFIAEQLLASVLGAIVLAVNSGVVGNAIIELLVQALVAPLTAIAATLMYLELRRLHGEPPVPATAVGY